MSNATYNATSGRWTWPTRFRDAWAVSMCGVDHACGCRKGDDDEPYDVDESMLPADWPDGPPVSMSAANCGTGAGGFQKGNTCAGGGYGADNKLRTSRTTLGNIRATGAKRTRDYTDGQGRKVVEHRTDDGRLFHEVTHANGRRAFHQVHGARVAAKPRKAKAAPITQVDRDKAALLAEQTMNLRESAASFRRAGNTSWADRWDKDAADHAAQLEEAIKAFPAAEADALRDAAKPKGPLPKTEPEPMAKTDRAPEPDDFSPSHSFEHGGTGLTFERAGDEVRVTGRTDRYSAALKRAGFTEVEPDDEGIDVGVRRAAGVKRKESYWVGTKQDAVDLDVPRHWDIPAGIGVKVKSKIGGGRKVV